MLETRLLSYLDSMEFDRLQLHNQAIQPVTDMDDYPYIKLDDSSEPFEFISPNNNEFEERFPGKDSVLGVKQHTAMGDLEMRTNLSIEADPNSKCDGSCPMREKIRTIVYWRNPATSGVLLACLLTLQISLMCCSAISVVAFIGLALFLVINGVRVYYKYVCKTEQPLIKEYLEKDINIPQDKVNKLATRLTDMANMGLVRARDIFFFKDVAASVKLIVLLYVLTYVGAVFDFMTLVTIATILAFTIPKFYEAYQPEMDNFIKIGTSHCHVIMTKLQTVIEKVPVIGNRKKTQ